MSLEARYDQFDEKLEGSKRYWKVACDGLFDHRLHIGYLRPFYQVKILTEHPVLWNYHSKIYFSVYGTVKDIPSLLGDLFLVHGKACGNWVEFDRVFGFLPEILGNTTDNQLAAPTPLWPHYVKVFEQHNLNYTVNEIEEDQRFSALLFSSIDFPDDYNYGQPFAIAESFELLESN